MNKENILDIVSAEIDIAKAMHDKQHEISTNTTMYTLTFVFGMTCDGKDRIDIDVESKTLKTDYVV